MTTWYDSDVYLDKGVLTDTNPPFWRSSSTKVCLDKDTSDQITFIANKYQISAALVSL